MYLLDTNICIHLIRKRPAKLLERVLACDPEEIGLSVITLTELAYGVLESRDPKRNRDALELFLAALQVLAYPAEAAFAYGQIRAELARKRAPLGAMDLMIAAHAMTLGATLVSNKPKEFRRISGLETQNWTR